MTNRREFLQGTAATGLAAVTGSLSTEPLSAKSLSDQVTEVSPRVAPDPFKVIIVVGTLPRAAELQSAMGHHRWLKIVPISSQLCGYRTDMILVDELSMEHVESQSTAIWERCQEARKMLECRLTPIGYHAHGMRSVHFIEQEFDFGTKAGIAISDGQHRMAARLPVPYIGRQRLAAEAMLYHWLIEQRRYVYDG